MTRCGLTDALPEFAVIAKKGLCTMNPQIGCWLREAWGDDSGKAESMQTMKKEELVKKLLPECVPLLAHQHNAGVDALLVRNLAYALYGLSRAPCRLKGPPHQKRAVSGVGGESLMVCSLCEERF